MSQLGLLATSVIFPVAAFVANMYLRSAKGLAHSTGADFLMLLAVFDLTVLAAYEDFVPFIADPTIRSDIIVIHLLFLLVTALAYLFSVISVETRVVASYDFESRVFRSDPKFPFLLWGAAWVLVTTIVGAHIWVYLSSAN